CLQGYSTPYSF
nr:immunoglobulin light chain junction region [Macaca mulatta]MOX23983.1 immunoglobulin light chain junction region [Macaca mulatta]MOX24370.1 immunoglobulin light chain junction region [Macaca mulatta]MOX24501.1 immunoglobulin light chain junction region [Macaca mulatta]MOX25496.1 immunoglobulin light chain junction region [Macaca mulatta]